VFPSFFALERRVDAFVLYFFYFLLQILEACSPTWPFPSTRSRLVAGVPAFAVDKLSVDSHVFFIFPTTLMLVLCSTAL
jgi:hypothetical protein